MLARPFSLSSYSDERYKCEVKRKHAKKTSFQCCLESIIDDLSERTTDETIPEAPRTSPEKRRSIAADKPMMEPPKTPDTNECMFG